MSIRVRFAPSPTGHLHIGGLRTALFNWLFARHNKGTFLIRIEDTDTKRSTPEFVTAIFDALEWASLQNDEPIIFQTQRLELYKQMLQKLLDEKKAYRCYCPGNEEKLESDYFKYDGRCRLGKNIPDDPNAPYVVRIALPLDKPTILFHDLIRGDISFDITQFDDFIIARSDGMPIYNFVVVVDDAMTKITHVIRGEDHISNTPKQIFIYHALGFVVPQFAHLPLILGPEGNRLSKRDAAASVLDYKINGYLPDALCNYLVRLGWSHGDQEIFTRDELVNLFSIEAIGKKGAIFDQQKLDWVNGIYLRQTDSKKLFEIIERDIEPIIGSILSDWQENQIIAFIDLYKQRAKTLSEIVDELFILYKKEVVISQEDTQQWLTGQSIKQIQEVAALLSSLEPFASENISAVVKIWCKGQGIKIVDIAQPIRLILTGKTTSPGVFDLLAILGKHETLKRLDEFLKRL